MSRASWGPEFILHPIYIILKRDRKAVGELGEGLG